MMHEWRACGYRVITHHYGADGTGQSFDGESGGRNSTYRGHQVKAGQTLSGIAGTNDPLTLDRLAHFNGLPSRHEINVGQVLLIPDAQTLSELDVSGAVAQRGAAGAVYYAQRQSEQREMVQERAAQLVTAAGKVNADNREAIVQSSSQNIGDNIGDLRNQADRFSKQADQLASAAARARGMGLTDAADSYQQAAIAAYYNGRSAASQALDLSAAKQWAMPQYPSSSPFSEGWNAGENSAGTPYGRGTKQADYLSVQANLYVVSGGFAVNLHNADVYGQWSLSRQYPAYSEKIGASAMLGFIDGAYDAKATGDFLDGAGWQANYIAPVFGPLFGLGGGINHSYGGATALEVGIGTPGGNIAPLSVGSKSKKPDEKP